MEAKLGFTGFTGYQSIFSKTVSLTQSQDSVVPDTLPDLLSIVCTSGCVLIRSKDVAAGHVRLEANVPARVCCSGEDGTRFCLDVNIPFFIHAEDESIPDGGVCVAELSVRRLDTRMLNPRKVSVRAELDASLICYTEGSETFFTSPEDENGVIHALEKESELTVISSVTEKTFVLTDEYTLPSGENAGQEIISQNAQIAVQEIRSVGSKLILKGSVFSQLLCMDESGEMGSVSFTTTFSQIIETETDTEDTLCDAKLLISGMYYELMQDGDGSTVQMELHLAAQTTVYGRRRVRWLADAYSNQYALDLHRQTREFPLYGRELTLRESFSSAFDAAGDVRTVISCRVSPTVCSQSDGEINIQLLADLCWKDGETVCSAQRTVTHNISTESGGEAIRVCAVSVTDAGAVPISGGAELHITVELHAFSTQIISIDCISGIEYDESAPLELDDRPTLVILYPGYKGELWTLAKENCSTVQAICAANCIEEDAWVGDQILLIPKTV